MSVLIEANDLPVKHVSGMLSGNGVRILVDGHHDQACFLDKQGTASGFSRLDSLLKFNQYACITELSTGHLAWGTRSGGVLVTDNKGTVVKQITIKDGLSSNHVVNFYIDDMDHLWVVHPRSLSRLEFPAAFTFFNNRVGLQGNVNDLTRHQGILYAATNHGLYQLIQDSNIYGQEVPFTFDFGHSGSFSKHGGFIIKGFINYRKSYNCINQVGIYTNIHKNA